MCVCVCVYVCVYLRNGRHWRPSVGLAAGDGLKCVMGRAGVVGVLEDVDGGLGDARVFLVAVRLLVCECVCVCVGVYVCV